MREPKRFWSKVDIGEVDECWPWLAASDPRGYGRFRVHDRTWLAHRVAWILTFGPIPKGLETCHKCDSPSCCNPYHLFLGTHKDNMVDASRKGRMTRGDQNRSSILTEEEVLDIRERYAAEEWTRQELADEFGVTLWAISDVVYRRTWRHI